jgi:hypothetical protein
LANHPLPVPGFTFLTWRDYYKENKMKTTPANEGVYAAHGYKNRDDYLNNLADNMGIDRATVDMISGMLGPSEDFDGLVSELEDFNWFNN